MRRPETKEPEIALRPLPFALPALYCVSRVFRAFRNSSVI